MKCSHDSSPASKNFTNIPEFLEREYFGFLSQFVLSHLPLGVLMSHFYELLNEISVSRMAYPPINVHLQ